MEKVLDPNQSTLRKVGWTLFFAATLVVISSRSELATPNVVDIDKVAHFSVYGLLGTLILRIRGATRSWAWWSVLLASVFGMTDEWHQSFTPGRSVEFDDWLADTIGAACGVALYSFWPVYRKALEYRLGRRDARS